MPKTNYADLDDLKKINKQWHKMSGLHGREEWSSAIVRAATATEIAANYAIRQEFAARSQFDRAFVDTLLRWANGIEGKLTRLLIPLYSGGEHAKTISGLKKASEGLNRSRNQIVHSGHFMNEDEARKFIAEAKEFIHTLVRLHDRNFALKDTAKKKIAARAPMGATCPHTRN